MLADALWPDLRPDRARRALSDTLYRLRLVLSSNCFITSSTHIGLNPAAVRTDVAEFNSLASASEAAGLRRAAGLYSGPLAPELYDDWLIPRRVALHQRYLDTLARLGKLAEAAGQYEEALARYRQLAESDPLREAAYRGMMRSLARLGRPAEALQVFSRLEETLRAELNVAPATATRSLAGAIRFEAGSLPQPARLTEDLPFVGRAGERASALRRVEEMLSGRGGAIAIEGPPGMGKSRLWEEIAVGARWRGAEVWATRNYEYPTGLPLDPLCELLNLILHGPRAAQLDVLLPGETLAALGDLYPPWRGRAPLPELPPPQARARFARSLVTVFRSLSELSPLLLLLDDMQWAAPALWHTLDDLIDSLAGGRLLLGLAYRRPDIELGPGWSLLQRWERDGKLAVLSLSPLKESEMAAALPPDAREHASAIGAACGGNPFYLVQATLASRSGSVPAQASRILPERLAALQPVDRQALAEASVLGGDVPFRIWSALSGLELAVLIESAGRLVAGQWLHAMEGGYSFAHDLIHAAVYNTIDPDRRRRLHGHAATALGELEAGNAHALAFHLDRAGKSGSAAAAYRAAGTQDLKTFSFADAKAAFERALVLWPDTPSPDRIETLFDIAAICDSTGDRDRQRTALEEAQVVAHRLENDAYVMHARVGLGRLAAVTGKVDEAAAHLSAALALAETADDDALLFEAHFFSGDLAARRGRLDEARDHFGEALVVARDRGDSLQEARALRGLSIVARLNGDPAGALQLIDKALALQVDGNDQFGASVTHSNRLAALYDLGAWDRLLELASEALALKEKLGDRHGAAIIRYMQGLAAHSLGDFVQARILIEAAEQEFLAVGDRRTAGLARNVLGLVAENQGRVDEARADLDTAIAIAEATGATTEAAFARHDLGVLLVRRGAFQEAIPHLEFAQAIWQEQGNTLARLKSEAWLGLAASDGDNRRAAALAGAGWAAFHEGIPTGESPQAWLWALGNLLMKLSRVPEALAVRRAAYAELERQAAAILDPALRRGFFENVPLNREIVAAREWVEGGSRQVTVSLTRAGTQPGESPNRSDLTTVTWTLRATDDSLIANPTERRRHVLQRLLAEAAEQGAIPTDDHLAAALGVSRRTVLRDKQAISRK